MPSDAGLSGLRPVKRELEGVTWPSFQPSGGSPPPLVHLALGDGRGGFSITAGGGPKPHAQAGGAEPWERKSK